MNYGMSRSEMVYSRQTIIPEDIAEKDSGMRKDIITIYDIARIAEVSASTVSRVLNGKSVYAFIAMRFHCREFHNQGGSMKSQSARMFRLTVLAVMMLGVLTFFLYVSPGFVRPRTAYAAVTSFAGVNWADARDNYNTGWVIPTGLTASDSYATVQTKANIILAGFQNNLGANTVRLPINPPSVEQSW